MVVWGGCLGRAEIVWNISYSRRFHKSLIKAFLKFSNLIKAFLKFSKIAPLHFFFLSLMRVNGLAGLDVGESIEIRACVLAAYTIHGINAKN